MHFPLFQNRLDSYAIACEQRGRCICDRNVALKRDKTWIYSVTGVVPYRSSCRKCAHALYAPPSSNSGVQTHFNRGVVSYTSKLNIHIIGKSLNLTLISDVTPKWYKCVLNTVISFKTVHICFVIGVSALCGLPATGSHRLCFWRVQDLSKDLLSCRLFTCGLRHSPTCCCLLVPPILSFVFPLDHLHSASFLRK